MKLNTLSPIILIATFVCTSCEKYNQSPFEERTLQLTADEKNIVSRSNSFAFDAFSELSAELKAHENLFFSPLSIGAALSMTANGAKGETLTEIKKALHLEGIDEEVINGYYQKLIRDLPHLNAATEINIANSIWYRQGFNVLSSFLEVNKTYFDSDTKELDFANPQSVDQINRWVNDKTKSKIPTILDEISADAVMFLINAVYFKADWDYKFDVSKTKKDKFKKGDGTAVEADFMEVEHTFNMAQTNEYEAVQLPYQDRKFDMILIKPKTSFSLDALKSNLSEAGELDNLIEGFRGGEAVVHLPKFKTSYQRSLNELLQSLGMNLPFSDVADFSRITENGGIKISEVKHKAFVEVHEEGTEAVAVTVVGMEVTSAGPRSLELRFDEPFLFLIRENSSGLILFAGQMNDPKIEETKK